MAENEYQRREAEEIGCDGLLGGIARNLYSHREIHASIATKADGPFYCPTCHSDALIHKCIEKQDHFAHIARLSPTIGPKESALHYQCKTELCSLLRKAHPGGNWDIERPIKENKEKKIPELRPDVSGRINGIPIAIEVQASALSITNIFKRTSGYAKRGIAILWLVPLYKPLGDQPFRPRLYERYFHSLYFGRTYYWWADQGLVLKPVHYDIATRHIEYKEWYENGALMTGGDYEANYRIIKNPLYGPDAKIDTNFIREPRPQFTPINERKTVPASIIWHDTHSSWWKK